jgi:hypothetical protein
VGIEFVVVNLVEPLVYGGSTGLSSVALIAAGEGRIRRRAPRARILVGFWGSPAREVAAEEMARATSAQAVAVSLRDAVAAIDSMLSRERAPASVT